MSEQTQTQNNITKADKRPRGRPRGKAKVHVCISITPDAREIMRLSAEDAGLSSSDYLEYLVFSALGETQK